MIKLYAVLNNRRTLILGLSEKNTEKLHDGLPIVIDVQALTQNTPESRPPQDIIICAGETELSIYAELKEYMPQLPPFEDIAR